MGMVLTFVALLLAIAAWTVLASALVRKHRGRRCRKVASWKGEPLLPPLCEPRVLLIRPCCGDEPKLSENLVSVLAAHRPKNTQVVLGVLGADDTSWPVLLLARSRIEQAGLECTVVDCPPLGPNRKASILAHCVTQHGREASVVISADSNVDLSGFDVCQLMDPLLQGGDRAATWATPVEISAFRHLGNRASEALLNGSLHSFPLLRFLDRSLMVGKLFAIRGDVLALMGGFESMTDYLGEDIRLSTAILELGLRHCPSDQIVVSTAGPKSLAETIERQLRWMMVVKAQRRRLLLSYPLFFAPSAFVLVFAALGALLAPVYWQAAVATLLLLVTGRMATAAAARSFCGCRLRLLSLLVDVILSEAVVLGALVKVIGKREISWRGVRLRLGQDGRLERL
ncbi:MAG: glycosyltransferase [Myxococcota bacterium]|nr:glycosyltransferase [Myxococcota bacterium]